MDDLKKAIEEATRVTKEDTEVKRGALMSNVVAGAEIVSKAGLGFAGAFGRGLADPMMLPSEVTRQAGKAAGQALGGVSVLGVSAGPEALGFIGEFMGAEFAKEGGAADQARAAIESAGISLPSLQEMQAAMGTAARQRFVEQYSLGPVREIAGRFAEFGAEPPWEALARTREQREAQGERVYRAIQETEARTRAEAPPAQDVRGLAGSQ
jgi:hypothetical protein